MAENKHSRNYLYRHISFIARDAGLDKNDRLSLAKKMFYGIDDIESYSELDDETLENLLWLLKGWRSIQAIRHGNGHLLTEAHVAIQRSEESAQEAAIRQTRDDSWN